MRLRFGLAFAALAIAGPAIQGHSQDGSPAADHPYYDTPSNADLIKGWLLSGDPKQIAFGANFAVENSEDALISPMEQLAAHWNPPHGHCDYVNDECAAMLAVLHALIQRKAAVPPEIISDIAASFPAQALILASRLPSYESAPLLQAWYDAGEPMDRAQTRQEADTRLMLAHVAAMMLSKAPPPGFAASVLAEAQETLVVNVRNDHGASIDVCVFGCPARGSCPDEFPNAEKTGWPPLYQYDVEENYPGGDYDGVVVETGAYRITYRRTEANWTLAGCFLPARLNPETRHSLLAEMSGVPPQDMPWQPVKTITLNWENKDNFLLELTSHVNFEESKLRATVQELYSKGFLTRSEANSVRPRLSIVIFDDRLGTGPALPRLTFRDSRTTYQSSPP